MKGSNSLVANLGLSAPTYEGAGSDEQELAAEQAEAIILKAELLTNSSNKAVEENAHELDSSVVASMWWH